ncbi:MAG: 4Fe-4S single cluster domain-containing protein [Pseudomonadota bacterium]
MQRSPVWNLSRRQGRLVREASKEGPAILNLHAIVDCSRANGPGNRAVIWFQGCTLACPGCFNPATHTCEPRLQVSVEAVTEHIAAIRETIEGVTISGGEPLQQPEALLSLVAALRIRTGLSVILFTGYSLPEARSIPQGERILRSVDVVIAGRYIRDLRAAGGLRGSTNQTVHLVTDRYRLCDIERTPDGEIIIDAAGVISVSGVGPPRVVDADRIEPAGFRRPREESGAELESDRGYYDGFWE